MLNTAMCSHGNRLFRLDTVEAKGITPLITPTGIRDHLDAVARQPMSQGAAANSIPQLYPQREIGVKSKVGRYAPKLRQPPQIVAWSFPYSFKTLVVYVKVDKMVETILRKGAIKGEQLVRDMVGRGDNMEVDDLALPIGGRQMIVDGSSPIIRFYSRA